LTFGLAQQFDLAQFLAAVVAMTSNYLINNEITYRDRRRRGFGLILGYLKFCALCSIGLAANVAVAAMVHNWKPGYLMIDGLAGASVGAIWNYLTTSTMVW
jgi:dolichol-phosphate mannosyltransferase